MKENTIYLGDSLNLIKNSFDIFPNLIIMSPPDLAETNYNLIEYKSFLNTIYNYCLERLDKHGVLISITTDRKFHGEIYLKHVDITNSIKDKATLFNYKIWCKSLGVNLYILNYAHILCFKKPNACIVNNKLKEWYKDVFCFGIDKVKGYKTKDTFPTELIKLIITNFTKEGDLVFDPFIGTGKSAVVALELKRKFLGFELNEQYFKIANERINQKYTENYGT